MAINSAERKTQSQVFKKRHGVNMTLVLVAQMNLDEQVMGLFIGPPEWNEQKNHEGLHLFISGFCLWLFSY